MEVFFFFFFPPENIKDHMLSAAWLNHYIWPRQHYIPQWPQPDTICFCHSLKDALRGFSFCLPSQLSSPGMLQQPPSLRPATQANTLPKRTSCPTCRGASQCSRYLDANPRHPARALCHSQRNEEFPASWCTQFVFILASKTQVTLLHLSPSSNLISEIKNVLLKHITCESYLSFWLFLIRKKK